MIRIERRTNSEHNLYKKAMALYEESFPPHEQWEAASQQKILYDEAYHFHLIYANDEFAGILLYWETESFLYVEHFCILSALRGCRYGQQVMELLTAGEKCVILEIDPIEDNISQRRKGFYERCGFTANPYAHVHLSYHRENSGHSLVVMATEPLSEKAYETFYTFLCTKVMEGAYT